MVFYVFSSLLKSLLNIFKSLQVIFKSLVSLFLVYQVIMKSSIFSSLCFARQDLKSLSLVFLRKFPWDTLVSSSLYFVILCGSHGYYFYMDIDIGGNRALLDSWSTRLYRLIPHNTCRPSQVALYVDFFSESRWTNLL